MKTSSDILMDIVVCKCPAIVFDRTPECQKIEALVKAQALAEAEKRVLEAGLDWIRYDHRDCYCWECDRPPCGKCVQRKALVEQQLRALQKLREENGIGVGL